MGSAAESIANPDPDSDSDPDAALMLRVKEGDTVAFEQIVEKYKQPVVNMVGRILNDRVEAEDVAQNVFVQVFKSAHRYKVAAKFSTWLYTIARNLCLNEIRRRSRHPAESMDRVYAGESASESRQFADVRGDSPPDTLLRGELEAKVDEAVQALPENQRTALLLYQRHEHSYEEISQVMGCSLSATKSLIHRARETLRDKLKPYLRTGAWEVTENR